ncbi:MAG TPA: hypothetical protein VH165_11975 [Kofleriaceae bacterium]|jgi:hypothetical protein|nr:hypothetical protein [Kofleriaceae bacterium]
MKRLGPLVAVALAGACATQHPSAPVDREATVALALPQGALNPVGYTSVDIVLHEPGGDVALTAQIDIDNGTFDLGTLTPVDGTAIEATLRSDTGAVVGYGRVSGATINDNEIVKIPVLRPIAYIAGSADDDQRPGPEWTVEPATFSDLSTGAPPDGKTVLASPSALMVAAGSKLFMITQAVDGTTGAATGMAQVVPVSVADHSIGTPFDPMLAGAVVDAAGTDDGNHLVIATASELYALDISTDMTTGAVTVVATMLAAGSFSHVAILTTDTGEVDAIAIKNRAPTTGTCASTAELWWAQLAGPSLAGAAPAAHMVATGGFSDVAADRGQAYYIDACKRELGTVTATATAMTRSLTAIGSATAEPTMLAVSNGQAYIGIEDQPATTSLAVLPVVASPPSGSGGGSDAGGGSGTAGGSGATDSTDTRMLWTEGAQQVVEAANFAGVQRQLDATSVMIDHLEIGAGGDYVALTTSAHFHGSAVKAANFPDLTIDADELRVFDASTGGSVERYRSFCAGFFNSMSGNDITAWQCAQTPGQTAPAPGPDNSPVTYDHHIASMTFLFGKK